MENVIIIDAGYEYKGSANTQLKMIQKSGSDDVDLFTQYDELITTVTTGYGLMRAIQDLLDGAYD